MNNWLFIAYKKSNSFSSLPFVAQRGSIVWLQVSTEGKYRLNNLIKELSQGIPGFF